MHTWYIVLRTWYISCSRPDRLPTAFLQRPDRVPTVSRPPPDHYPMIFRV
ncbi:hypothetical protein [Mariniradius sediminis]|uniref:Uncharacterized protein n=1 Tax=Mariniradius sediminis TaxID=2909237 RepID=A0ABS9BZE2_9BACT|nr:hypothetical protein [Mariniradius sediminis]MCF1753112.1 hypothetical protein [Mariniradius sediminis]